MNKFESFTLNHFLSLYPEHVTFDDVLELIANESDKIVIWHIFESIDCNDLCELIVFFRDSLSREFK